MTQLEQSYFLITIIYKTLFVFPFDKQMFYYGNVFFLFFYEQNPIQFAFIFILFIYSVDNYKIYIQIYFIEILLKFDKLLERWLNLCVLLSVYF